MRPVHHHIVTRSVVIALLLIGCGMIIHAQKERPSRRKQAELKGVRESIERSQSRLERLGRQAEQAKAEIGRRRRESARLDTAVTALQEEERAIAVEMIAAQRRRDSLNDALATMTDEYARMARALYKQRLLTPAASMLLMPVEHRRLTLREKLFERYARLQRERAHDIAVVRVRMNAQDSILALRRREYAERIDSSRERIRAAVLEQDRQVRLLTKANTEQTALRNYIARRSAEARRIEEMIAGLAARERREIEAEANRRKQAEEARRRLRAEQDRRQASLPNPAPNRSSQPKSNATSRPIKPSKPKGSSTSKPSAQPAPKPVPKSSDAAPKRSESSSSGQMPALATRRPRTGPIAFGWPVAGRTIVQGYGERVNPRTNTVTVNPGINIASASGTAVRAAEDGTVSLVSWLPSYGTIVIVEHRDGYRSVYANLASATVSSGAEVKQGERIGSVGESIEGTFLHFEVWKEQNRLNPIGVLP